MRAWPSFRKIAFRQQVAGHLLRYEILYMTGDLSAEFRPLAPRFEDEVQIWESRKSLATFYEIHNIKTFSRLEQTSTKP